VSGGRVVRIEKLASTGEGIVRAAGGVGFVDRALPGELVETNVYEVRKRFWRGSLVAVREPSPDRVDGPHAGCAGCDWAHFAEAPAREAKRALFLETMQRLGKLDPASFGVPEVVASAPGYRLRSRLHVSGCGPATTLGYFAPGTHRVASAASCEALSEATRALLPELERAIAASGAAVAELTLLEDLPGSRRIVLATAPQDPVPASRLAERLSAVVAGVRVADPEGRTLVERGERSLALAVGGRDFAVSAGTFFQGNRHLVSALGADVAAEAARDAPGLALDAFGGVGLFAGALLSAGHRVVSVEGDPGAVADARRTRDLWGDRERWEIETAGVSEFLAADSQRFVCVVVDPPRSGLGLDLAGRLARAAEHRLVYVSCDTATLARDLPVILAEGFAIRRVRLYDLFAYTHRIEALVALERVA
jgi:23S rRNA (uracil1939-C5)-methyltransferase